MASKRPKVKDAPADRAGKSAGPKTTTPTPQDEEDIKSLWPTEGVEVSFDEVLNRNREHFLELDAARIRRFRAFRDGKPVGYKEMVHLLLYVDYLLLRRGHVREEMVEPLNDLLGPLFNAFDIRIEDASTTGRIHKDEQTKRRAAKNAARDKYIREKAAAGLSSTQIAQKLATKGYEDLDPRQIRRIVNKKTGH